jgi:hypothetical protein
MGPRYVALLFRSFSIEISCTALIGVSGTCGRIDLNTFNILRYSFRPFYNRLSLPGTFQGSISFPPVIGQGSETLYQ